MKIAIVGAGAIGGYLGARLALAGEEVTFLARNKNLAAINTQGFRLIEEDGSERTAAAASAMNQGPGTVRAVADGVHAGPQDAVLLTVKAHQVADVLPTMAGLLGPGTSVVTMINGVPWWYFHQLGGAFDGTRLTSLDPDGAIAAAVAPERVIGSVVYPASELLSPGVVKVIEGNRFSLGEPSNEKTPRIEALSQAMIRAGFKSPVSRDIRNEIWVKLWGNCTFNPLSALTRATLQDICQFGPTRQLATAMMSEAKAVAEALGVRFKISLEQRLAGAEAVGAHKTSMLQDLEAGRALELDALLGAVTELGRITGVATPTLDAIEAAVRLLAQVQLSRPS
jgi:2-dehydropantoate 2-reductase